MIPYNIMGFYAASMLVKSLTAQLPVISRRSDQKKRKNPGVARAVLAKAQAIGIGAEDIDVLYEEARHTARHKVSICKSLLYFKCLCSKDRDVRLLN